MVTFACKMLSEVAVLADLAMCSSFLQTCPIFRGDFTKYLATGSLLEKLPKPCLHLQFLTISICFNDVEDILTTLCLLRSSPALEKVEIWAHHGRHYQTVAGKVNSWVDSAAACENTQLPCRRGCTRFCQISAFKFACA